MNDIWMMVTVVSSLLTLNLCNLAMKAETDPEAKQVKFWQIMVSSALLGAPGALLADFILKFRRKDAKFISIVSVMTVVQLALVMWAAYH